MFRFFIKPSSGSHSCQLNLLVVHYYFSSILAACHILYVMGLDFILLVLLVLISCVRACHAWLVK